MGRGQRVPLRQLEVTAFAANRDTLDKVATFGEAFGPRQSRLRVAFGGMTLYRRPVAAALAMASLGFTEIEVVTLTGGIETDILIGAGCARRVRSCYVGFESLGFAPHFTREATARSIDVVAETEYTVTYAVQAAAMRVPFLPMQPGLQKTDIAAQRPDIKAFPCPLSGTPLLAVPAIELDIAVIHAPAADTFGNTNIAGQLALDPYFPAVARRTIVTAERIVPTQELEELPGGVQIPGIFVDAVVHAPEGSRPTSCYPLYEIDVPAVLRYVDSAADSGKWERWLDEAFSHVAPRA